MGYSEGFPIEENKQIKYYKSIKKDGETVYYMVDTDIKFVFYN